MGIHKHWTRKPFGFSLLELMVVVAILGILATVAVPRFNIFRARSRQSEAKTNLGVIFTLQESFAIDQERYFDGDKSHWGGDDMKAYASADGYRGSGSTPNNVCGTNKLVFRLANCDKARYGYFINGAGETDFLAIAYAASDKPGEKRVFPGCDGAKATHKPEPKDKPSSALTSVVACDITISAADTAYANANSQFASGDAWCLDEARRLYNYRDVTEYCD